MDSQPPAKRHRTDDSVDPFAQLHSQASTTTKSNGKDTLLLELADYNKFSYVIGSNNASSMLLEFWRTHQARLPLLSTIAKRILVIQGSSSESERHFSAGGMIVSEKRSRASADTVESLIVLRESFIKNQWPDSNVEVDKEKHEADVGTTTLTPEIISL
jgi:hypothetical protein